MTKSKTKENQDLVLAMTGNPGKAPIRGNSVSTPSWAGLAKQINLDGSSKSKKVRVKPWEPRKIDFYPGGHLAPQIVEADGGQEKHVKIEKYIDKMRYL